MMRTLHRRAAASRPASTRAIHRPFRTSLRRGTLLRRGTAAALAVPLLVLAFSAGCGSSDDEPATAGGTTSATPGAPVTVTDPWVKTTASGMTAAFGTLTNNTDREMTVVSGTSPAAKTVELHEVAMSDGKSVMRPKAGGFVVPAHGSHALQPGGDHLMLMSVTAPVKPGDRVPVTLTLADGGTVAFTAVAKDFAGGKENYQPGGGHGTMSPSGQPMSPSGSGQHG